MNKIAIKREREDSVEREDDDPVSKALRKFQAALESSFPLKRISDLHDETEIKDVALKEREKIYKEFMARIMKFTGDRFTDLFKELETEVQMTLDDFLKKSRDFREVLETFMEQMFCEEYKKSVEFRLAIDKRMDLRKLRLIMSKEIDNVINSFCTHWKWNVRSDHAAELDEKLVQIQEDFIEKQRSILESPESSSTATSSSELVVANPTATTTNPFQQHVKYEELEGWIFLKLEKVVQPFSPLYSRMSLKPDCIPKSLFKEYLDQMKRYLQGNHFTNDAYIQRKVKLLEVIAMAEDVLNFAYPITCYVQGNAWISKEDGAAWAWALYIDVMQCFSDGILILKNRPQVTRWNWGIQLINSKRDQYRDKDKIKEWNSKQLIICKQLDFEMDGIKLDQKKQKGRSDPQPLLIRLRRVWEAGHMTDTRAHIRTKNTRGYGQF